jgi:hypothetical protein
VEVDVVSIKEAKDLLEAVVEARAKASGLLIIETLRRKKKIRDSK